MKMVDVDWRYLLKDTLWPASTALVAIVVLAASFWFVDTEQQRYAQFSSNRAAVNNDYDELIYRQRLVNRYLRRYEYFQKQGFVGSESRLDWIESLRIIAKELGLPHVTYALQPQRGVIAPVGGPGHVDDIKISQSTLELEIGLIHELDLLRFVDKLQSEVPGLIKVERCTMTRESELAELSTIHPNIVASCSIVVFSVTTPDVTDNEVII
ncbi:MAG: hypothetical protein GXP15_01085 [Gammaproteobacteria bacterium]|nr:hypothetical protein [Gammaproteobacteria bacterium]